MSDAGERMLDGASMPDEKSVAKSIDGITNAVNY